MGNCTIKRSDKPSRNYSSSVKISVPDLTYVDRKTKTLISVIQQESFQISLKKKVRVYKDSCISSLSNGSIIIAGGSDSSNSLTNGVFILNPNEKTLKQLPGLPIPCKFGSFVSNSTFLYYVGGLCESQDHDSCCVEEGAPICRLSFKTLKWELFSCRSRFNPAKYLQRRISVEEECGRVSVFRPSGIMMKDLYEPGVVMFKDKIFLIGGKILQNGELVPSCKIFSIQTDESNFSINEELLSLPTPLISPSCSAKANMAYIAGGFLSDMSQNIKIYVLNFSQSTIQQLALSLDRPLEPRYPIFTDDKGITCISPPKMLYLREDKQQIFSFSMPTVLKQYEFKSITNDSIKECEYEKKIVDLSLNFIVVDDKKHQNSQETEEIVQKTEANFSENPFEEAESGEIKISFTDPIEVKNKEILNCECGKVLNKDLIRPKNCSHCKGKKRKIYFCDSCRVLLCKTCALELRKFVVRKNSNLLCGKQHFFCEFKDKSENIDENICKNCGQGTKSPCLYCFVCKETLCHPCEDLINSLISPIDIQCALYHQLTWSLNVFDSNLKTCDLCLNLTRHIGYFSCLPCKFLLCITCVNQRKMNNPSNKTFFKAGSFQERPKRLSDTLYRNESIVGDEPIENPMKLPKLRPFYSNNVAKVSKVQLRIDSEPGADSPRRQKFETTIEEIRKKIPQKPKRGNSPFLSLSPKKNVTANNSDLILSPVIILKKALKNSSDELDTSKKYESDKNLKPDPSNPFTVQSNLCKSRKLDFKLPDTEGLSSCKFTEPQLPSRPSSSSENDSQLLNPLDSNHASFNCSIQSLIQLSQASKNNTFSSDNQINIENIPNAINEADLLTPCNRLSEKYSIGVSEKEPSLFSTYGDDPDNFVAPDIRGTLAAGKLTALKAKFNILTSRNDVYSSTSEENSPIGFVFTDRPRECLSSLSSVRESISKRESKRYYSIESQSFSKDDEVEGVEENSESGYEDYQIQFE